MYVGNLNARRDWGHAKDYVEMQWRMLQQEIPEDYVISTGRQASVRDFIEICAGELGWYDSKIKKSIIWKGEGLSEIGIRADNKKVVIRVDSAYFRPTEVETLLGDASKAKVKLGWSPKISLKEIIKEMIKFDLKETKKEVYLSQE